MRSRVVWLGVLVVCGCCLFAAAGTAADHGSPYQLVGDQPEPDNTVTRITLQPDGDAVWTVRFRTRLATAAALEEYEAFQADFEANTSRYLSPFAERMTRVVAGANDSYDRDLRAVDFEARTSVQELPQRWGVVAFEFRWVGFATVEGERLEVGDVFAGGFFIAEGDVLELAVPDGYAADTVEPTPDEVDDGVVQWTGREDFADRTPRVVATPAGGGLPGLLWPAAGLGVLVVLGVLVAHRRGRLGWASLRGSRADASEPAGASAPDSHSTSEPPSGAATSPAGPDAAASPSSEGDATTDSDVSPPPGDDGEVRTNEEQVIALLEAADGQRKQAAIGAALGWSDSKTSRVLSSLADEGTIEKIRIGRENVIRLQREE